MAATERRLSPIGVTRLAIIGLSLVAWALRLYRLEAQPLWSDEGLSLYRSALPLAEILSNRIVVDGVATRDLSPPLFFALLHAARTGFGDSIFGLRIAGVMLGTLCVPLIDAAGRRLFGRTVGIAASLFLALSPFFLWYSQELRQYPLQIALSLAALVVLWDAVGPHPLRPVRASADFARMRPDEPRLAPMRPRYVNLVLWLVLSALSVYVHYFAVFVVAAQGLILLILAWRSGQRRAVGVVAGLAVVIALPLAPLAIGYFTGPRQVDYEVLPVGTVLYQGWSAFAQGISPSLSHPLSDIWPLGLLLVMGTVVGLWRRAWRTGAVACWILLAVPVAGVIGLSRLNPIYNGPRHLLPALPAFYLLAGVGAAFLVGAAGALAGRRAARRGGDTGGRTAGVDIPIGGSGRHDTGRVRIAIGIAALAVLIIGGFRYANATRVQLARQFFDSRYIKDDLRSAALDLAARARPGDLIILHDALIQFVFGYDYDRTWRGRAGWITWPRFGELDVQAARRRLLELGADYPRVWFLAEPAPRGFPSPGLLPRVAHEAWTAISDQGYPHMWLDVGLVGFDTGPRVLDGLPEGIAPVSVGWDNGLAMVGQDPDPAAPGPGRWYRGRLFWRLDRPAAHDYGRELRLVDADGEVQWRHSGPLAFDWPVVDWPAGRVIATPLEFELPADLPAGRYSLELRLIPIGDVPEPAVSAATIPHDDGWLDLGPVDVHRPGDVDPAADARLRRAQLARDPDRRLLDRPISFAAGPAVVAYGYLPEHAKPGQRLGPLLTWAPPPGEPADASPPSAVRVVDAGGRELARSPLVSPAISSSDPDAAIPEPPVGWPGDLVARRYALDLPADLAPGAYRLQVGLAPAVRAGSDRADEAPAGPPDVQPGPDQQPEIESWSTVASFEVDAFPIETTLPAIERPHEALFGDAVVFRGYNLCGAGRIETEPQGQSGSDLIRLPAGEPLCLDLVWEATERPDGDYKVFVHVQDPGRPDTPAAQSDAVPVGWTRPTGGWRPGEVLVDRHVIDVTGLGGTPRDEPIVLGMYDPISGRRLPIDRVSGDDRTPVSGDALPLARLRIEPAGSVTR